MSVRGYFSAIAITLLLGVVPRACWAKEIVEVGVLVFRGTSKTLAVWQPTLNYLEERIPNTYFRLLPLTLDEMEAAVARDDLDIVLTNPGQYVTLETKYGLSRLLTLRNRRLDEALSHFGAVIFTRADREDINTLLDLKNRSMGAVSSKAFGGFQMAWYELLQAGIDPFRDMTLSFSGFPQDDVVLAVQNRKVDIGTVRTDVLEQMSREGTIHLADFKILHAQSQASFPFMHSTRLYPEWAIARSRKTDEILAAKVMLALLRMPADSPALTVGQYAGWDAPADYSIVHQLLKSLDVDPYQTTSARRLAQFLRDYEMFLWFFAGFWLFVFIVVSGKLKSSNRRLVNALGDKKDTVEVFRERTYALERFVYVASHDLREPLSTVRSFVGFIEEELGEAVTPEVANYIFRIKRTTTSMNHLIDGLLRYSSVINVSSVPVPVLLTDVFGTVTEDVQDLVREKSAKLDWRQQDWPRVLADSGQMHELFKNLLINALKYAQTGVPSEVVITCRTLGERLEIRMQDNGTGFDMIDIPRIFEPFERLSNSGGVSGSGVGLAICQRIVEMHGGVLLAESATGKGASFILTLPLSLNED
jgi:signal transduction histidine kinase